ncbi:MAG: trigger factor [Anaerolineales bacterium]|nr:trigger factor [Anaerolineales bacterium]
MKIETEELADRQTQIIVELPDDRIESAMRSTAKRLGKGMKIAGFRPGKAPYNVILHKIGEDALFEEALESLSQEAYREALEDAEIEPYAPGTLDEIVSREPLILRYTVPMAPEVDLGAYHDLRLDYEEPEVEDEAVNRVMEDLRQRQALIEPVERAAELGDLVVVDIKGTLLSSDESEPETLVDDKELSILLSEETTWPFQGVTDHLVGMEAGDEKSVDYVFPDDYVNESMRGLNSNFHFECLEVKSRFVPEWSDELAQNLGEFDDLLALRINVREQLAEEAKRQADAAYAREVVDAVVDGATVSYPPVLLQEELSDMLRELEQRLTAQRLSLEDYLKIENKTEEELRSELEPQAEERLQRALVLGKVVAAEEISAEESEVDAEIERILESLNDTSDQTRKFFDNPTGRRRIELDLFTTKAIERLVSIAKGEWIEQDKIAEEDTIITTEEQAREPESVSETLEGEPETSAELEEDEPAIVNELEKKAPEPEEGNQVESSEETNETDIINSKAEVGEEDDPSEPTQEVKKE